LTFTLGFEIVLLFAALFFFNLSNVEAVLLHEEGDLALLLEAVVLVGLEFVGETLDLVEGLDVFELEGLEVLHLQKFVHFVLPLELLDLTGQLGHFRVNDCPLNPQRGIDALEGACESGLYVYAPALSRGVDGGLLQTVFEFAYGLSRGGLFV